MTIINADAVEWAKHYRGELFHAMLCDAPYHLYNPETKRPAGEWDGTRKDPFQRVKGGGFMGKTWDGGDVAFRPDTWAAFAQVLYDGAFGMAFASARGWHRMAVAIEDAGLIIHPTIFGWAYGSGFPKATRIDTQIDKAAGAEREIIKTIKRGSVEDAKSRGASYLADPANRNNAACFGYGVEQVTEPSTDLAKTWAGHRYGLQMLKPALEPIIVFQKPYRGKPVDCITTTGAGALWIDGGRIGTEPSPTFPARRNAKIFNIGSGGQDVPEPQGGRWASNFVLVHDPRCDGECVAECPIRLLDEQSGISISIKSKRGGNVNSSSGRYQWNVGDRETFNKDVAYECGFNDTGGASRFFFQAQYDALELAEPVRYVAKASRKERDAGLDGFELKRHGAMEANIGDVMQLGGASLKGEPKEIQKSRNPHPTVKPIALARYLATLLLPPTEYTPRRIFIPFAGVASEMIGAMQAGWEEVVGVELTTEYIPIAEARYEYWSKVQRQTLRKQRKTTEKQLELL